MKFRNTTQSWVSTICVPLVFMLMLGGWTCSSSQTSQQKAVAYVELAINTTEALIPVVPQLAGAKPFLDTALAGVKAWQPGQPIPQNAVAALQSALAQAEQSFSGLSAAQEAAIGILVATIISALQIAGVVTVSRMKTANDYVGKSPAQLKKAFNDNAKAAGVHTI